MRYVQLNNSKIALTTTLKEGGDSPAKRGVIYLYEFILLKYFKCTKYIIIEIAICSNFTVLAYSFSFFIFN